MGKSNFKRIGTFADFCKSKQKQSIKESNQVAIDVPFWDDAIKSIISDLRELSCSNPIDWDNLVKNIKVKFSILDIFNKDISMNDELVITHIKDILYFRYGDSFLEGDTGGMSYSTAEMGAKSLVISQLAEKILDEVKIEAGILQEPTPEDTKPVASVCLDNYYCYDDDYCGERRCAGFGNFAAMLKESVNKISLEHDEKALDYCLNKLEKDCGGLKLDDILKKVEKEEFPSLDEYLSSIVGEYLNTATFELNGDKLKDSGVDRNVLKPAKKLFSHIIVEKLIERITKENKVK